MPKGFVFLVSAFCLLPSALCAADAQSAPADSTGTTLDFANGLYARKMYAPAISEYEKFIAQSPNSPEISSARFRAADSYYFSKEDKKAISYFKNFIKDFPSDKRVFMARFRIASAHAHLKQKAAAIRIFLELSKVAPEPLIQSGSLFYLGKIYDSTKKSEKSLGVFEELLKKFPDTEYAAYASVGLGDHYVKMKQYDKALEAYKPAAGKSEPREIAEEGSFKIAEIYFNKHDYENARIFYQKTIEKNNEGSSLAPKALLGLFYCDYNSHNLGEARSRLQKSNEAVTKSVYGAEILYLMASLEAENKNFDAAMTILDQAIAHPSADAALKEKAIFKKSSVLGGQNKNDLALLELEKVLTQKSGNLGRANFEKGLILEAVGKNAEAMESYKLTLGSDANDDYAKPALYQSALLALKMNDPVSARTNFQLYITKYPSDPMAERAMLESAQMDLDAKDFEKAVGSLAGFIQNHPQSTLLDIAYYKWAVALTGLKRFAEAAEAFKKVAETSSLYPEALYGAAVSLESQDKVQEALPSYERLINAYPLHALSQEMLSRLVYLYLKTENFDKASALYQDILLNKPSVKVYPDAAFWLLQHLLDRTDYTTMQKILAVLPERFPGQDYSHPSDFHWAESYAGLKNYSKAVEFYSKAIGERPDGTYVGRATLGRGLAFLALSDLTKAESDFNQALRFDQELKVAVRAHFEIANLRLKSDNLLEAAKAFMLVAILYDDPNYTPLALFNAGECFVKLGRTQEAAQAFSELKSRYSKSSWAKKAESIQVPSHA